MKVKKSVRFHNKVTVFHFKQTQDDVLARRGHWVTDAMRFQQRVNKLSQLLSSITMYGSCESYV